MALNIDISMSRGAVASQRCPGTVTVTNLGANSVTLQSLQVVEPSGSCGIAQPSFLNLAIGTNPTQPTIAAGAQGSFQFALMPTSPAWAGPNADATNVFRSTTEASEPLRLTCNAIAYDATAAAYVSGQGFLTVGVKAAVRPNSPSLGGALQFNGAANAVNSL